tara:strand:- start:691 stop:924 length:234 start_codon:yes stop_codon:yes gene_type:complete
MEPTIETEDDMNAYYKNFRYLVIYPNKEMELFNSLRIISDEISIDYSTISKKLNEKNPCICKAKGTNYVFLIYKLNI